MFLCCADDPFECVDRVVSAGVISGERCIDVHGLPADFQVQTGYHEQLDADVKTAELDCTRWV